MGKQGAGIFDVDGTLIGCSSERTFFVRLVREGLVGPRDAVRWVGRAALEAGGGVDAAIRGNRAYLAGKPAGEIAELAAEHAETFLRAHIPQHARDAVRRHKDAGDCVFLVSGSLDALVAPLAAIVEADAYRASTLATTDGRLTGRLDGTHPVGSGKVEVAEALAASYGFSLDLSVAYGDRPSDAALMSRLGNGVAVNPRPRLARYARRHGWDIVNWHR